MSFFTTAVDGECKAVADSEHSDGQNDEVVSVNLLGLLTRHRYKACWMPSPTLKLNPRLWAECLLCQKSVARRISGDDLG